VRVDSKQYNPAGFGLRSMPIKCHIHLHSWQGLKHSSRAPTDSNPKFSNA